MVVVQKENYELYRAIGARYKAITSIMSSIRQGKRHCLTALRKNCQKLESERNNSNEEQILTAKTKCSGIQ